MKKGSYFSLVILFRRGPPKTVTWLLTLPIHWTLESTLGPEITLMWQTEPFTLRNKEKFEAWKRKMRIGNDKNIDTKTKFRSLYYIFIFIDEEAST